jgi:hypothetical protein
MVHLTERSSEDPASHLNLDDLLSENHRFHDPEAISIEKNQKTSKKDILPTNLPIEGRKMAQRQNSYGNISQSNINHDFKAQG